jgi:hypothetical protein
VRPPCGPHPRSRLEQLAWNLDVDPDELREWLRGEIAKRHEIESSRREEAEEAAA